MATSYEPSAAITRNLADQWKEAVLHCRPQAGSDLVRLTSAAQGRYALEGTGSCFSIRRLPCHICDVE
eukprot:CAMPEP_0115178790 /NCGR_PEP_ID=MMETSP0270-20121206/6079_1 /TAXON_ID=71861 /ORGANISM="Scrippsiella trochoidea, Strain CCMP3099" /LENGTH=67 /DNA_ID=CAMNT_0002591757 /DNA_START=272 /DNA_END=472 /DNA_ORIENTATION=-